MLQQTQVARVLKHWGRWMATFPTADALAAASTSDVLSQWQGLGYNRRALALKRACEACAACGGRLPDTHEGLMALPGIGPATAAGVMAFALNRPGVYLETNVRTVFLHELFPGREGVRDRELVPLVAATCPKDDARAWYYALLDYGAHLKSAVPNPSRRSAHHARQSAFEGSRRRSAPSLCASCWPSPASAPTSWRGAWMRPSAPPAATGWMRPCSNPSSPTSCPRDSSAARAIPSSPERRAVVECPHPVGE